MSANFPDESLDRALAEIDRRQRRFVALWLPLGAVAVYALMTWGIPRFETAIAESLEPHLTPVLTCGPFCEVEVTPVGGHRLCASCVCPGAR